MSLPWLKVIAGISWKPEVRLNMPPASFVTGPLSRGNGVGGRKPEEEKLAFPGKASIMILASPFGPTPRCDQARYRGPGTNNMPLSPTAMAGYAVVRKLAPVVFWSKKAGAVGFAKLKGGRLTTVIAGKKLRPPSKEAVMAIPSFGRWVPGMAPQAD